LINRYTVRRLTWRYSRTSSVVRKASGAGGFGVKGVLEPLAKANYTKDLTRL
jgi:hypothetical protein